MQTMQIKITGRVQGVFFRQGAQEKAIDLGIKGTVRNCEDDSVEIIATGSTEQLDKLIAWCWHGPPRAVVVNVKKQELPLREFKNFYIINL
jgi:acylphosphatase